jgi:hypothetical protein
MEIVYILQFKSRQSEALLLMQYKKKFVLLKRLKFQPPEDFAAIGKIKFLRL